MTDSVNWIHAKILLVEDDEALAPLIIRHLTESRFEVSWATDAVSAWRHIEENETGLVILDVMLPGEDGLSLCRRLRKARDVPIIMVTARGQESDRIVGLQLGADDYIAKPFSLWELQARMQAVLRRYVRTAPAAENRRSVGVFVIDLDTRAVCKDGRSIEPLTRSEFDLLARLTAEPGHVFSRETLLECIQGGETDAFDRAVDTHISNLRRKLEDDPKTPRFLKTVWGVGYCFSAS